MRFMTRIEGMFWLTRPASMFGKAPPVLCGYLIGGGSTTVADLALLLTAAVAMQLLITSLNDVFDAPRDAVTAPYLPIPAGIVSRRQAVLVPALCGLAMLSAMALVADAVETVLAVLATAGAGMAIGALYGVTKSSIWSPLLAATGSIGAMFWGWLLSARDDLGILMVGLSVMLLHGIVMNIINQVRDGALDPAAGNRTWAARQGARRATTVAALLRGLELVGIVLVAVMVGEAARGLVALLPLAALAAGWRSVRKADPGALADRSSEQLESFRRSTFLAELSLVFVVSPIAGVALAAVMWSWYRAVRPAYTSRVVRGGLRAPAPRIV